MKEFISFLLLALFTVLMGLMFTNCGARKKSTSETKIETIKKDTLSVASTSSGSNDTKTYIQEQTTEKENAKEIQAEVKQGEELRVDEYDKNGKLKGSTVFKGSGKAVVKEVDKSKASAIETQIDENSNFQNENKVNASNSENTNSKSEVTNLDRKETFSWSFIWILVILLGLFILYDAFKRKTM